MEKPVIRPPIKSLAITHREDELRKREKAFAEREKAFAEREKAFTDEKKKETYIKVYSLVEYGTQNSGDELYNTWGVFLTYENALKHFSIYVKEMWEEIKEICEEEAKSYKEENYFNDITTVNSEGYIFFNGIPTKGRDHVTIEIIKSKLYR